MTIAIEPRIGDTKKVGLYNYIYAACKECGETRWTLMIKGVARAQYCVDCGCRRQEKTRYSSSGQQKTSIPEKQKDKYDAIHKEELEYCEGTGRCPKCESMIIMQDEDGYHCFCGKTIYG